LPLAAGRADVELAGPSPRSLAVDVAAGETKEVEVDGETGVVTPAPAPAPSPARAEDATGTPPMRIASYVAAGVGVIGLGTFAIFGAMSNAKYNDLKSSCNGACPPSRQSDIDAGKRDQRIANVGLVIGILGAGAAVTLFVLSRPNRAQPPSAALVVGPRELAIRGAF
jgi:hypothetical protein